MKGVRKMSFSTQSVYKQNIEHYYMEASKEIGISKDFADLILKPEHSIETTHQIYQKDNNGKKGKALLFKGYRSIHKSYFKPSLGGFRMDQTFELEDYEAMAQFNSIRFAICKIPMTGSGGGISLAKKYRENETLVSDAIETFVTELGTKNFLGPHIDVNMTELNTGALEMDIIAKSYIQGVGNKAMSPMACATGKSPDKSGINLTINSKGAGAFTALDKIMSNKDFLSKYNITQGLKGKKIILNGFGERSKHLGILLKAQGAIITGIYEQGHGISSINAEGFDPLKVKSYHNEIGRIHGYPDSVQDDEVFFQPCDILISGITGITHQFSEEKAKQLRCGIFVENSMGVLTPDGDSMLNSMGVLVVPDVLSTLGEPVASYIEYMVNTSMNIEYASLDKNVSFSSKDSGKANQP